MNDLHVRFVRIGDEATSLPSVHNVTAEDFARMAGEMYIPDGPTPLIAYLRDGQGSNIDARRLPDNYAEAVGRLSAAR